MERWTIDHSNCAVAFLGKYQEGVSNVWKISTHNVGDNTLDGVRSEMRVWFDSVCNADFSAVGGGASQLKSGTVRNLSWRRGSDDVQSLGC